MFQWLQKWFTNNLWLKIIALILAIISWIYINEEVKQGTAIQPPNFISRFIEENPIISKSVPIVPKIKNSPPPGFKVKEKEIYVTPPSCKIWGREDKIKEINNIFTTSINVEDKTETFQAHIPLTVVPGMILPEDTIVEVKVPIVKRE